MATRTGESPRESEHEFPLRAYARRITHALAHALVGVCLVHVGWRSSGWLVLAARRIQFPYELEWMEGGMLCHVAQILQGRSLYPEPGPEFMPFLYTPLYHYVAAAAALALGLGLPALRLVSLLGFLGCLSALAYVVWHQTRDWRYSAGSAALLVATFPLSGAWFDLARVDSLAWCFALTAIVAAVRARSPRGWVVAGVCVALAFLTKQTTLAVGPALAVFAWWRDGWRGATAFLGAVAVAVGVPTLALTLQSHGWYWYYTVQLPGTHDMMGRDQFVEGFWRFEMAGALPIVATAAALGLVGWNWRNMPRPEAVLTRGCGVCLLLGAYLSRLHMGSFDNDLIPAHIAIAWLASVTTHDLARRVDAHVPGRVDVAAALLLIAQLWLLPPIDAAQLPTAADMHAGNALVDRLRNTSGEVLVINHPHFALLAGKRTYAHQMAMIDVFYAARDPKGVRELLRKKWKPLLQERRFASVIADNDWYVFQDDLVRNYRLQTRLELPGRALLPKTGTPVRPELVYEPHAPP